MIKLKLLLFFCMCVTIVSLGMIGIISLGILTLLFLLVKYVGYKFKDKLGKIFN